MGGVDASNETCKALRAIQMLDRHNITVDVVTGASNPNRDEVEKLVSQINRTTFYCNVNNMAELMAAADLCVGAGGHPRGRNAVSDFQVLLWYLLTTRKK